MLLSFILLILLLVLVFILRLVDPFIDVSKLLVLHLRKMVLWRNVGAFALLFFRLGLLLLLCPLLVHLCNLSFRLLVEPDLFLELCSSLLVLLALKVILQLPFLLERFLAHGTAELFNNDLFKITRR